jgi:hypothetical protein
MKIIIILLFLMLVIYPINNCFSQISDDKYGLIFTEGSKSVYYDKSNIVDDGDSITVWIYTFFHSPVKLQGEKNKYYDFSMKKIRYYCGKSQQITFNYIVALTDGSKRTLIDRDIESYYIKEESTTIIYHYFCESSGLYRK